MNISLSKLVPSAKEGQKTIKTMQTFTLSKDINSKEFTFPRLIGLTAPKGMGKTTFANRIGGEILSLATPIKHMLELIIPKIYIYEEKEKQVPGFAEGITARVLMQRLGTEFGRACNLIYGLILLR